MVDPAGRGNQGRVGCGASKHEQGPTVLDQRIIIAN